MSGVDLWMFGWFVTQMLLVESMEKKNTFSGFLLKSLISLLCWPIFIIQSTKTIWTKYKVPTKEVFSE